MPLEARAPAASVAQEFPATASVPGSDLSTAQPAPVIVVVQNPPGTLDRVRGTALPGSLVTIATDSSGSTRIASGLAGADGNFVFSIGDNQVATVFVQANLGGLVSLGSSGVNEITTPPAPTVSVIQNPGGTPDYVIGDARPGARVLAYRDTSRAVLVASGIATAGRFALSIGDDLTPALFVTSVDAAGNPGPGVAAANSLTAGEPSTPTIALLDHGASLQYSTGQRPVLMATAWDFKAGRLTPTWKGAPPTVLGTGELLPLDAIPADGLNVVLVEAKSGSGIVQTPVSVTRLPKRKCSPFLMSAGGLFPGSSLLLSAGKYRFTPTPGCRHAVSATRPGVQCPELYNYWEELWVKPYPSNGSDEYSAATFGRRRLSAADTSCDAAFASASGPKTISIPKQSFVTLGDWRPASDKRGYDALGCLHDGVYFYGQIAPGLRGECVDEPPQDIVTNRPNVAAGSQGFRDSDGSEESLLPCLCASGCSLPTARGSPVDAVHGGLEFSLTDLEVPSRGLPLRFTRTYNSRTRFQGALGHNWNHSFSWLLQETIQPDGTVKVSIVTEDAKVVWFVRPFFSTSFSPAIAEVKNYSLQKSGADGYDLTRQISGELPLIYHFESYGAGYRLSHLRRTPDYIIALAHELPNFPESPTVVTDTQGRRCRLAYTAQADSPPLLNTLTEERTGRLLRFRYSQGEPLLLDVADSAAPMRPSTDQIYFYGSQRGALVRVLSADGSTVLTAAHDPLTQRVTALYQSGIHYTFAYDPVHNRMVKTASDSSTRIVTYATGSGAIRMRQDASGALEERLFDATGEAVGYRDPKGRTTSWTRSSGDLNLTGPDGNTRVAKFDAEGFLTSLRDELGLTALLGYDDRKRLISLIDPAGARTQLAYNSWDKVESIQDARGNVSRLSYDGRGNLISVQDAEGRVTRHTYDGADRLASKTDPAGNTTLYSFDSAGRLRSTTDALGQTHWLQYDSSGRLVTLGDPAGGVTTFAYDPWDRRVQATNAAGQVTRVEYAPEQHRRSVTSPRGFRTTDTYSPATRTRTIRDTLGVVLVEQYDATGQLAQKLDGLGRATRYTYDLNDRLASVTQPGGADVPAGVTTRVTRDAAGRVAARVEAAGTRWSRSTSYAHDAAGRVLSIAHPDATTTSYQYDLAGNLTSVGTSAGTNEAPVVALTRYEYDKTNLLTAITGPAGTSVRIAYDLAGNLVEFARGSPAGALRTRYGYDKANRLTGVIGSDGVRITYVRDALGQIVSQTVADATADAVTTRYVYDRAGRRIRTVFAAGTAAERAVGYEYDAAGNLISVVNGRGKRWTFVYDARERLIRVAEPLGRVTGYELDAVGNVLSVRRDGVLVRQTVYNAADRPVVVRCFSVGGTAAETVTLDYDPFGNLLRSASTNGSGVIQEFDLRDRVIACRQEPVGKTVRLGYDRAGGLSALSVDGLLSPGQRFWRDLEGRLTRLQGADGEDVQVSYDDRGLRSRVAWSNGLAADYGYDAAGRIARLAYSRGQQTPFYTLDLQYDGRGNVVRQTDERGVSSYEVDALDQLTKALYPDGSTEAFTYDGSGNRTSLTTPGGRTDYEVDDADKLVRLRGAGGETSTATYGSDDELVSEQAGSEPATSYSWDATRRLIAVSSAGGNVVRHDYLPAPLSALRWRMRQLGCSETRWLWTPWGNPLLELAAGETRLTTYVAAEELDEVYAVERTGAAGRAEIVALVRDHLGSVLGSAGPGGMGQLTRYRAFGETSTSAEPAGVVTVEIELHRGVNFVCMPARTAAVPTVQNLADKLGSPLIVWTEPDASGRGVFRSWPRGLGQQPAPPLEAVNGYVVIGTSSTQAVVRLQGRNWANSAYRVDLAPGLNLVGVPKKVAATRTTAELLALTSARFAVTLAGAGPERHYRVYLPGDAGQPLVGGASYLLALPRWLRVDLVRFERLPAELRLGFTGRDSSPDGLLLNLRNRWYRPNLGRFISQDPIWPEGGINAYTYVSNNPLRWTDPTGEKVYVGQHGALLRTGANIFQHRSILLVPDNPADFRNHPLLQGGVRATLGGQPGRPGVQRNTPSGTPEVRLLTLRSAPNFPGDALSGDYVLVETPPGQTDTDFIMNLIGASEAYTDPVEYSQFPCPSLGTYNSNSYVAGVIKAAGGTPPIVPGLAPGYDSPLPIQFSPRRSFTPPPRPQPSDTCPDCRIRNIGWRWNY